jgi:hypothetical protein
MTYNLTPSQKEVLQWLVIQGRNKSIPEEFLIRGGLGGNVKIVNYGGRPPQEVMSALRALANAQLVLLTQPDQGVYRVTLLGEAYTAVDSNFDEPDDSFIKHLTPLAHTTHLDSELKKRCLPSLATGSNPSNWDNACRTAGVILEERLRDVGAIKDTSKIGLGLVNEVFSERGTLAAKVTTPAERQGYRDLYAGFFGVFRNPSAHRLADPTPEEGGAFIVFVDLLLKKLEALR